MKKICLLTILLTVAAFGFSQRWQHVFGYPNTNESCNKAIELYDKGYLLSSSFDDGDNWIIKTDINGNIIWDKLLTCENSTIIPGYPLQDSSGNFILAGSVYLSNQGNWPMINKLDECGNPVFCRIFKDDYYDWAFFVDAILLENQDILALAHHEVLDVPRKNTLFLYYITSDGELLWKKAFGKFEDYPLIKNPSGDKIIAHNGNYYISGDCYYAYPEDPDHFWRRAFFCGIDSLFNEKWILPFGMDDWIPGESYTVMPLNDSVLMGAGIGFFRDDSIGSFLYTNSYLMFVKTNGEQLGYTRISNSTVGSDIQGNFIRDIERINDTLFMAAVCFGENIDTNPLGEFVIDTSGNIYNKQSRPNTSGSSKIIKTFDSKYAISAGYWPNKSDWDILFYKINSNLEQDTIYPGTYVYDSLCPDSIESGIIDISDCMVIVNTDEIPGPEEYFSNKNKIVINAMPNPATGSIKLLLKNKDDLSNLKIICSDTYGRKLYSQSLNANQTDVAIDISAWPSGMYITYITSNGKVVGQCRFVVR